MVTPRTYVRLHGVLGTADGVAGRRPTRLDRGRRELLGAPPGGRVLAGAARRGGPLGGHRSCLRRTACSLPTWAAGAGVEPTSPSPDKLAAFARWLERTPSRKHRPGRNRRRAPDAKLVTLTPARSPATVDGILVAVVEFVRFSASRGWSDVHVAGALSRRMELRFIPPGFDRGQRRDRPVIDRRLVRRRRVERPPMTLTAEEVGCLVEACANARDRFVVEALMPRACGCPSFAGSGCRTATS